MSRAWYMDSSDEDQRLEHHLEPPQFIEADKLKELSGVLAFKVSKDVSKTQEQTGK